MAISLIVTDADALKAMAALLGTTTVTGGGTGGTTPPQPAILTMALPGTAGAVAPGATVELGAGPDTISLVLCSNNNAGPAATPTLLTDPAAMCWVAVQIGDPASGPVVAGPLYVSASSGEDGGQRFNIHGTFGSAINTVTLLAGGGGSGINNLWYNALSANFLPLKYNGPAPWAPGPTGPNTLKGWDEFGIPLTFTTAGVVAPPPVVIPPPMTSTIVSGATINGASAPSATLDALIAATPANGTLLLPAGTINGTSRVSQPMTIQGTKDAAGNRLTIIDGAQGAIVPAGQKALLVPTVAGLVVRGLVIKGAAVPAGFGGNAAAIRQDGEGYGFEVDDCEITECQNGLLTFAGGPIIVSGCHIHNNGNGNPGGAGATHEIYTGGGDGSAADLSALMITNTKIECGPLATHAIHNRCKTFHSTNCDYVGNGDDGTNGGSVIDVANGGDAQITGGSITIPASAGNRLLIQYGEDGMQPIAGSTLAITSVVANTNGGAGFINGVSGGTLEVVGSTYLGTVAPAPESWGTVKGAFVVGGAPGT